jgi:hypothetical protein
VREIGKLPDVEHRLVAYISVGVRKVAFGCETRADRAYRHASVVEEVLDPARLLHGQLSLQLDGGVAEPRHLDYRPGELFGRAAGDAI